MKENKIKMKTIVKGISMKIFRRIALELSNSSSRRRTHDCSKKIIQQFALEGSQIYLPKLGSVFSRTKSSCFENCILLAFDLGMCEGVGEDSRHEIGHVDIQVGSCICLSVIVCHDMCT